MNELCDLPEFFSYTEPVARKPHRCCECKAPIKVGEKHFRGIGVWDGFFEEYRQHYTCMEACMLIRDEFNSGSCIPFGSLKEEFSEMRGEWFKDKKAWQRLRDLMAEILHRERNAK